MYFMKKALSLILCAVLLVACAVPAFAESKSIVLLGDSIARGAGVYNSSDACYGKIVADTIGYEYVNFAVDGHRTIDLLGRLSEQGVRDGVAKASIISISIGGNNYLTQNLPKLAADVLVNNYEILDDIEEDFIEDFARIIDIVKGLNPSALLLINTLYNPQQGPLGDFYGNATTRINRDIYAYLDSHPGAFLIVDTIPYIQGNPECVAVDTIHPSAIGNREIAKAMLKTLNEAGVTDKTEPTVNPTGIDEIPFTSYIFRAIKDFFVMIFNFFKNMF